MSLASTERSSPRETDDTSSDESKSNDTSDASHKSGRSLVSPFLHTGTGVDGDGDGDGDEDVSVTCTGTVSTEGTFSSASFSTG